MAENRVLLTGGSGFIGRNVLPILRERDTVFAPRRHELNIFSEEEIKEYIISHDINAVVHCANPNPANNPLDTKDRMLRDSLQMFVSIYNCRDLVDKVIYMGSGAIYDKTKDITSAREDEAGLFIPKDDYGFAKYIMNYLTAGNVFNLCVFGCYGPSDADSKFITHCIRCCLRNEPITIRQNCMFDYLHVYDLGRIISWLLHNDVKYNMYNACSGKRVSLLEIAEEVKRQMDSQSEIVILKDGYNNEYTGSNERLLQEYKESFITLQEGIKIQIGWEKENYKH